MLLPQLFTLSHTHILHHTSNLRYWQSHFRFPCRRRIYTVLRSPHVNKDSREQFELRTHQRLIDVKNLSPETVDRLMQLDLPAGVDVEVKL